MMNKNDIQKWIKPALCGLCLILTGCSAASLARESTFESSFENGGEEEAVNIYTSDASVIIEGTNEQEQTITVHLIHKNESRTLSYNGATLVWDKYGSAMTMAQLRAGDIADISYNSELEKVGSVSLSEKAWSYEGIDRYILDAGNGSAAIGDEMYSIGENVMVFSDGEIIDTSRIIRHDVLTFHGMDHNIMSITVDKGHGYLDLENEDAILGGWIEIGQAVISQVAPDMLLTVPEGNYTVRLTADGVEETREVTIERNKETVLNLEDIEIPEPEDGVVIFEITPTPSAVYVDDKKVETKYPLRLPLGLHQVTAEASGYETLSQYFEVEGKSTTVKMNLAERASVSGNNITETKEEEEKKTSTVTIDLPNGVEVYQDNLYMGIAPVTYDKTPGDHTITLRKSGYITRSYSINIADDDKDVTYSFPDLDPESSNNTVSGNTVSGNTANEDKNKNEDRKDSSKDHGSTGNTGNQGNSGSQGSTGSNDNTGGSGNSVAEEGDHDNTVSGNTISGNTLDEDSDA
ncbi:MAG: PEGA domain-containing protein [Lachnospiraceae bacterium]|nr:PEGA domain-containing protein [Lachnospiraceae bacterium]